MSSVELIEVFVFVIALIAAFGLGAIAGCVRWSGQRRTNRRLSRSVESLTAQLDAAEAALVEADAVLSRVTDGTDDIVRAAKGAHHRTEETDRG